MNDPFRRPALTSGVFYRDPWAALDWLEKAFGFERTMVITDEDGNLGHSEMRFGDGYIMVGGEWADDHRQPGLHRRQEHPVDPCPSRRRHRRPLRARAGGRRRDPAGAGHQFYGDRTYRARDPEGHVWTFGQTVRRSCRAKRRRRRAASRSKAGRERRRARPHAGRARRSAPAARHRPAARAAAPGRRAGRGGWA